jgi:GMP synthase (glutamine-hydrolysing)
VYADDAPHVDPALFDLDIPTLGICYGAQLMALDLGGKVERTGISEFGKTGLTAVDSELFAGLPDEQTVWMSHRDTVTAPPPGAEVVASRRRRRSQRSSSASAAFTASVHPESCIHRTARIC